MDNPIVIHLLKKIIKLKKIPTEARGIAKNSLNLLIAHHYAFNYINQEDYENLKYFFKKLLTNNK